MHLKVADPLDPPSCTAVGVVMIQYINNDTPFIGKATGIVFTFHVDLFFSHCAIGTKFTAWLQETRTEFLSVYRLGFLKVSDVILL